MEGPTQAEVDATLWWHPFTFPNGVRALGIKGGRGPEYCEEVVRAEALAVFKYSVEGRTVLDVGAANGYFSLEAVRRGAKRVVALDRPAWEEHGGFQGFQLVRQYLAPSIEALKCDVMDLRAQPIGQFDCVLFLGVLYHLKHPLYVLESLFNLTRELLVLETHLDMTDTSRSAMAFYPGAELAGDQTNWWGPNVQCVIDMLRTVGFSRIEYTFHPFGVGRAFFYAFRLEPDPKASGADASAVIHRLRDGSEALIRDVDASA
jgi:tRNA (mo5U34)-methyltransferase